MSEDTTQHAPTIIELHDYQVVIEKARLKNLLDQLDAHDRNIDKITASLKKLAVILDFIDPQTGELRPEIMNGDISIMQIVKGLKEHISFTDIAIFPSKFERDMIEKFGFLKDDFIPILKEYANRTKQQ